MVQAVASSSALAGRRVIKSRGTGEEHWRTDFLGRQGNGGAIVNESTGGGAADAGIAMHHQRRAAIPTAHEFYQFDDVLLRRMGVAVDRRGDVVHAEDEMVAGRNAARALDPVDQPQQRHNVARLGLRDGVVQAGEGADVDHAMSSRITPII